MSYSRKGRSFDESSDSEDDEWEHHQAHRERRDLYERLENVLPAIARWARAGF